MIFVTQLLDQQTQQQPQQQQPSPQVNMISANKSTKQDLLDQCTQKLNQLRSLKTVITTNSDGQPQQQLVLTQNEFEQMKKLMELQSQLQNQIQNELQQQQQSQIAVNSPIVNSSRTSNLSAGNSSSGSAAGTISISSSNGTPIKLNELSLNDKYKLNEIIKNQLQQIQNSTNNATSSIDQQQNKEKYIMLFKKQAEIQSLINQHEKLLQSQSQSQSQQANSNETSNTLVLNRVINNYNSNNQNIKLNGKTFETQITT